jgi:hypothetical protein
MVCRMANDSAGPATVCNPHAVITHEANRIQQMKQHFLTWNGIALADVTVLHGCRIG